MPNHVTNIVKITGDTGTVNKIVSTLFTQAKDRKNGEDNYFDLNRIVPMPAILEKTESGTTCDIARELRAVNDDAIAFENTWRSLKEKWGSETLAKALTLVEIQQQAIEETGFDNWYDWCIANWGTKWTTYSHREPVGGPDGVTFRFDTAWTLPIKALRVLSGDYPEIEIHHYYNEEGNEFYGALLYRSGVIEDNPEFYSEYHPAFQKSHEEFLASLEED
jgi:hypothetical protein